MGTERKATDSGAGVYVLPRYLRYARTLALVSGAAVGVAAGAAVISTAGCELGCTGICGYVPGIPTTQTDASADVARPVVGLRPHNPDSSADVMGNDADTPPDAGSDDAGDTGGGPRPAPPLPRAWIA